MKLSISGSSLNRVAEIWAYGENVLVVQLKDGKRMKLTAARNMYSSSSFKYVPFYEEQVMSGEAEGAKKVWVTLELPSLGSDTIEHCLEDALKYINDELK